MITLCTAAYLVITGPTELTAYQDCKPVQIEQTVERTPLQRAIEARRMGEMKRRGKG